MTKKIRIGLVGAGGNTRTRHIPGLLAQPNVELVAVCNRRPESTLAIAQEFGIPKRNEQWEQLVADPDIDAVVIGTWPYLHCPVTVAALHAGKHVLTEARMSMNAGEAHHMLKTARLHAHLVTQVVPSPFGLRGHHVMRDLLDAGYLGQLREVQVASFNAALADSASPLSWRQDAHFSGFNLLNLGILHETLSRWLPEPVQVQAQVHAHLASRIDPQSGVRRAVGTPDSAQVFAVLPSGARVSYHLSSVTPFGQSASIRMYGSEGTLCYDLLADRITGLRIAPGRAGCRVEDLQEIAIPAAKERSWRVEADFIDAIREGTPIELTTFDAGVAYMEFTEAVVRSAEAGEVIALPLHDFVIAPQ